MNHGFNVSKTIKIFLIHRYTYSSIFLNVYSTFNQSIIIKSACFEGHFVIIITAFPMAYMRIWRPVSKLISYVDNTFLYQVGNGQHA